MEELAHGYGLIEGPVWVAGRGLLFSDVHGGGVYCLDEAGAVSTVFPHRRGIGGMAVHERNGMVVGGRNIAYKPFAADGGDTVVLLDRDPDHGNVGYNDLTTDAAGRIYAGSLGSPVFDGAEQVAGDLYLVDLDGSSRIVGRDVQLTNGLGFSPDGRTLYHSDSRRQTVFCYAVADGGDLGPKVPFARTEGGAPDGLAVAEDGSVWVAVAGGSGVDVFEADGRLREHIGIPKPMCTSVCFGGDDLEDLYIVTGSPGGAGGRDGTVYRTHANVAGLPVPAARTPID